MVVEAAALKKRTELNNTIVMIAFLLSERRLTFFIK
jgi:hypothetical protein